MLIHFIAISYLILLIALSYFVVYRLKISRTREAGGAGLIYSGLALLVFSALINLLQQQSGYSEWFLSGIYAVIDLVKFIGLAAGSIIFAFGLALYFSYWNERDREVANQLGKLRLLESLQQESRFPFPMSELLDRMLKGIVSGLDEEYGAIFLLNRSQRQFVLTSAVGLSKEETSLLEYYPYGRNLISQAIEDETALLSSDFRSLGGKAQLAASRFHSILVQPLISGKEKLGAVLFLSTEERHFSREFIALVAPVTEWLAEKIQSTRLVRELNKTQRELESRRANREELFSRLGRLFEPLGESISPSAFAEKCVGLVGCNDVWLIGLVDGRLGIHGGTSDHPDFSDNFRSALLTAIPRNKAVILNQEGTDDAGHSFIARSSVFIPADNRGNAILFRNNEGAITINEDDLRILEAVAGVAGLVINNAAVRCVAESRSRWIESISRVLSIGMMPSQFEQGLKAFADEVRQAAPGDSLLIVFRRENEHYRVFHSSSSGEELGDISIVPGEGSTGRVAVMKECESRFGEAVKENLDRYDDENRGILGRLFGEQGYPMFQGDYPLLVNDRVEFVITLFGFQNAPGLYLDSHRLISVMLGLMNLKIEIAKRKSIAPEKKGVPSAEPFTPMQINELNNDLAAISGYCQMARRDPNLSGEAVHFFESIFKIAHDMAGKVKSMPAEQKVPGDEIPGESVDVNKTVSVCLQKSSISGNLYMISGKPFEVNLKLGDVPRLPLRHDDFEAFMGSACAVFTESVSEDEIITVSSYAKEDLVYVDISRHRKNFPAVEPVAGFGRYLQPAALEGALKAREFLKLLDLFGGKFAYDKFSQVPSYFSFRFHQTRQDQTPRSSSAAGATILAVDDQLVILELLAAMCQSMGHKILTARNGREGLDIFQVHKPDIVIADLVMPGMSGLELAAGVKALSPSTPVIMITGWGSNVDSDKISRAGVDFLLHKPFRLEQLAELLTKVNLPAPRK